ncbi:MAG: hypothetical protein HRU33_12490 [Rhodobacteraceae bacterium]|nr:hypothetical protein [Paracoccaceae bacterium]
MHFDQSLWNDSEPLYAPCMKHRKGRGQYFWRPPKKYLDAGYAIKTYTLLGREGDGQDLERARQCRALTREMLQWHDGVANGRQPGTWGWLIARYKSDEFSDIHGVRASTRLQYLKVLAKIEEAIADVLIAETDYIRIMGWKKSMADNGRSTHYIKKWFTHWGLALSHGIKIGVRECRGIKAIREEMRIKTPARRSTFITRPHVEAIVAEADKRKLPNIALAVLIRFEFMLRGVDVYGQWEPSEGREGGIQTDGQIWVDGLTWDMFDSDLTTFSKVISKTRDSMPDPYSFDLTNTPDIRRRLSEIPRDQRAGPVIVLKNGRPPKNHVITRTFKAIVRDLGLPEELQIRDTRSGGITEAKTLVDPYTLQHAAQHTQGTTTDIYARDRSGAANNVVRLRSKR